MNRPNIQRAFLDKLQEAQRPATVITANGYQMRGTIIGHDRFTLLVDVDGQQHLIYKSAVSTIKGV